MLPRRGEACRRLVAGASTLHSTGALDPIWPTAGVSNSLPAEIAVPNGVP
jgi:hypothetical protein